MEILIYPIFLYEQKNVIFPECVARVSILFGGLRVRLCLRKVVFIFATVCGSAIRSL